MANGAVSNPQLVMQNSSPTRVSPVSHQSSMSSPMSQGYPFPNQPSNTSIDPRLFNSLTPQQQANLSAMNPQQRQLVLLQQQQLIRGGQQSNPGMMNSGMMNPQMLAAAQERLQHQARMSQASSPTGAGGNAMDPAAVSTLRSNPGMPGIARSTRTPSDHMSSPMTPQSAQRQSSQSAEEYQRAMIQHTQRGMTPQTQSPGISQLSGAVPNGNWQQGQPNAAQMGHGQASYGMASPGSAGGALNHMPNNAPSPVGNQGWSQNGGGVSQYPFNASSPVSLGQDGSSSRQTSMTPAPHQMSQNSPVTDQNSLGDFDLFNWNQ